MPTHIYVFFVHRNEQRKRKSGDLKYVCKFVFVIIILLFVLLSTKTRGHF